MFSCAHSGVCLAVISPTAGDIPETKNEYRGLVCDELERQWMVGRMACCWSWDAGLPPAIVLFHNQQRLRLIPSFHSVIIFIGGSERTRAV